MESYIVQLDFSATLVRVSHNGLLFKLKYIGVSGSVLTICREFFSDRRQRVVVDGATSKWIPIVSARRATGKCVLGSVLFILYTSDMFGWVASRLYVYADDSTYMHLSASQQTDLLVLLPLTGTWLGFRSGAIIGA